MLMQSADEEVSPLIDNPNTLERGFANPESASTVSDGIDSVFNFITWLSVIFFVAIVLVEIWFIIKYKRSGHEPNPEKPTTHNTPLELVWTIIPLLLVIAIFYVGVQGFVNLRNVPPNAYEINVTAQKWSWTFTYPNGAITTELVVPAGEPVKLIMKSNDVLHSLFVPAFRVKQDVVPGRYTYMWFEAQEPADGYDIFDLYCTEYCGKDHSSMTTTVHVMAREQFDIEIAKRGEWWKGMSPLQVQWEAYERIYPRCSSCHSVDGSDGTGPSWQATHSLWGQERLMNDGTTVTVDENYIRDSILNPAKHIAAPYANAMPTFKGQLKEQEIDGLVSLLKNLTDVVAADGTEQRKPEFAPIEEVTEEDGDAAPAADGSESSEG